MDTTAEHLGQLDLMMMHDHVTPGQQAALTAAIAALKGHDGMVMVPRVPTEAMVEAGAYALAISRSVYLEGESIEVYAAMLAAAPQPPKENE